MSEVTGRALSVDEVVAIGEALHGLPDDLGARVIAGLAAATELGERLTGIKEGDSAVPGSRFRVDRADTKERYKAQVITSVANRLGIDEPEGPAAHAEVRSRLTWAGFLASDLVHYQK